VQTAEPVIPQEVPETLRRFVREGCGIAPKAFRPLAPTALPEPDRRLLVHANDMTSTLAAFHESVLHVELFQCRRQDDFYLREVFLRTTANAIVEYGVIAIALEQFTAPQQEAILAGKIPLGGVLHRYQIPFVSAPIGFFSMPAVALAETPFRVTGSGTCHGRFNRLAKPTGEALAWILEILPPSAPR
jgi:hypothetical protein